MVWRVLLQVFVSLCLNPSTLVGRLSLGHEMLVHGGKNEKGEFSADTWTLFLASDPDSRVLKPAPQWSRRPTPLLAKPYASPTRSLVEQSIYPILHFSSVVFASINCSDALITRLFCGARK
jgi:hypothetical protein